MCHTLYLNKTCWHDLRLVLRVPSLCSQCFAKWAAVLQRMSDETTNAYQDHAYEVRNVRVTHSEEEEEEEIVHHSSHVRLIR